MLTYENDNIGQLLFLHLVYILLRLFLGIHQFDIFMLIIRDIVQCDILLDVLKISLV